MKTQEENLIKKSAVDLTELAVGIVVLGIVVSIGATVLVNIRDIDSNVIFAGNATAPPIYEHAGNVSNSAAAGLTEYGNWFTILVIVGISAVVLSLIFLAFGRGGRGEGSGVSF